MDTFPAFNPDIWRELVSNPLITPNHGTDDEEDADDFCVFVT